MIDRYNNFRFKNIILLILSIIVAIFLWQYEPFHEFLISIGEYGYLGAFIAGILFVWIFSMPTALIVLFSLSEAGTLSPLEIGILAGTGAVIGDLIIFKFIRGGLIDEIEELYSKVGGGHLFRIFDSKYFHWTLPVIGAISLASPLPDEIGVSLLGISKMKTANFIILSFLLNSLGIYLIVILGQLF